MVGGIEKDEKKREGKWRCLLVVGMHWVQDRKDESSRRDKREKDIRTGNGGGWKSGFSHGWCSFSTVRNRVLGCVNPVTYGGHSGLRAPRPSSGNGKRGAASG